MKVGGEGKVKVRLGLGLGLGFQVRPAEGTSWTNSGALAANTVCSYCILITLAW